MKHLTEDRLEQIVQRAQLTIHQHDQDPFYEDLLDIVSDMVDLLVELRKVWEEERAAARVAEREARQGPTELQLMRHFVRARGLEREFERWAAARGDDQPSLKAL